MEYCRYFDNFFLTKKILSQQENKKFITRKKNSELKIFRNKGFQNEESIEEKFLALTLVKKKTLEHRQ